MAMAFQVMVHSARPRYGTAKIWPMGAGCHRSAGEIGWQKTQHQVLIVLLLLGRSPKEGRYTFRKLDQNSGLVLDGGEEVAPGLTIWWHDISWMECFKHLHGSNPRVNGVIVDQASAIYTLIRFRKVNLQVARLICKVLSDEELKWSCSGSLREVKITKSELMKDPSGLEQTCCVHSHECKGAW